ncbi:MAG TPA: hypothetical protein VIZ28_12585 [Chitinophagaceae bacterium]
MKRVVICLLVIAQYHFLAAQSIGIGTTSPHSSAMLDIVSNSKGFLLPRMTSAQRTAIVNPPAGLMVYETTFNRFYTYDGSGWNFLIDNDYWTRSSNVVGAYYKNIGIGTVSPQAALDVWGNARISTGNLLLAQYSTLVNSINFDITEANSNGANQSLYFTIGSLVKSNISFKKFDAAGEDQLRMGFFNITASTFKQSGEWLFNGVGNPTLQLQNDGIDKGFLQVSGTDDFRTGTNADNDIGRFIVRMDGTNRIYVNGTGDVGIGTSTPLTRLHVAGNTKATGSVTAVNKITANNIQITGEVNNPSVTGTFNMVPLAYGYINPDGTIEVATPNVSSARLVQGVYEITIPGLTASCTIIVTGGPTASYYSTNKFRVTNNLDASEATPSGARVDGKFYFMIFQSS